MSNKLSQESQPPAQGDGLGALCQYGEDENPMNEDDIIPFSEVLATQFETLLGSMTYLENKKKKKKRRIRAGRKCVVQLRK